ncbi:MAG TPA: ABC transporter ATP-binding protein [Planctomycetaceae bacterium]|nr:ABC transporter ATP-binding protein [Planctomycetaceae bacterium]
MPIKEITLLLSSVGFSSPPSWLRPFGVLSNGEQFRATMARALAESGRGGGLVVMDEFTSVVDRTVAQIGSAAVAKTIRRRPGLQFVAVTCHYDVVEWLDPDWIYEPASDNFQWRLERRGRPRISLEVARVGPSAWRLFRNHHYLSANLNGTATCFCAFLSGSSARMADRRPVALSAWLPFVGWLKGGGRARRNHRTVCLPDFQGVGIGQALGDFCASLWAGLGYRAFTASGHPGEIAAKNRSANWRLIRPPSRTTPDRGPGMKVLARSRASNRFTASFEYVGSKLNPNLARRILG